MTDKVMCQVYDKCVAIRCHNPQTHVLTMKHLDAAIGELITETGYCLECGLHSAAWLPYCYPDEYVLVSLLPPASELFERG